MSYACLLLLSANMTQMLNKRNFTLFASALLIAGTTLTSCKKKGCTDPVATNYDAAAEKDDGSCSLEDVDPYAAQKQDAKVTYANIAYAVYDDSYELALDMQTAINAFVANPTQVTLDAAKQAWLEAREPYGQSEIFRFVDGPIDNDATGPEGLLNAWPMDEAYVDYVTGSANSGIINDVTNYPTIDAASVISANEFGSESNVSLGYHAIEFLLWGQDESTTGPGARPFTDFVTGGTGTAANQDRRGEYLVLVTDLLVGALDQVRSEWDPSGSNNYRVTWLAIENDLALRKMFNSIRVMAGFELSGERMITAHDNMDQEDEHSCFSDNTHRDIITNAQGVENLFLGSYTKVNGSLVSGYSLRDLCNLVDASNTTSMVAQLADAKTKCADIYIPFDQAIILPAERPKVIDAANSLIAEETLILAIADSFGINF